ncbi:hypothetical protein [Pseudoalteromonas sp. T1lg23B]|uniref:hypothetical protein n=1 Tax=Pseudoalteromonas sp. T1lg23B TaxID=2077097 RepID=UPI000CF73B69|nr:hypothetical protein [Pseudoalteromonas sp. T1lg23B]
MIIKNLLKKLGISLLITVGLILAWMVYVDLHLYLRPTAKELDTLISQQLEAAKQPSATVLIFEKDKVLFSKGYGYANIEQ